MGSFLRNAIIRNYAPVVIRQVLIALGAFLAAKGFDPEITSWVTDDATIAAVAGIVMAVGAALWGLIKRPSPAGMEAAKAVDKGVEAKIETPPGKPDMIVKPVRVGKRER